MANFYTPKLAVHNPHRTLPAPEPHPPSLARMYHLGSADLQPEGLVKLQFRDRLCIRTCRVQPLQHVRGCGALHFQHSDPRQPLQTACIDDLARSHFHSMARDSRKRQPPASRMAVVELLRATTTKTGLKVECALYERT